MALLVRSWNVFHGNASPVRRRSYLREMIELATADSPDVLCLQEVPVWALDRLVSWSGMSVYPAIARKAIGPAGLAGWATRFHNGLLRSAITGQANALLVRPELPSRDCGAMQVSDGDYERRVCQAVDIDNVALVVNTHLSSAGHHQTVELDRVLAYAESSAAAGEPIVLAGDFNLQRPALEGFSPSGPGIDHVLVRGATAGQLVVWPEARRRQNGVVLSDHAPVELAVG